MKPHCMDVSVDTPEGTGLCLEPNDGGLILLLVSYLGRHARADGQKALRGLAHRGQSHDHTQKLSPQRSRGHLAWPLLVVPSRLCFASTFTGGKAGKHSM